MRVLTRSTCDHSQIIIILDTLYKDLAGEMGGKRRRRQPASKWMGLIIAALGASLGDQKDQIILKEVYLCESLRVNVDVMMHNQLISQSINHSINR